VGVGGVPVFPAFLAFLEAEKRVPAGLLVEAVGTEGADGADGTEGEGPGSSGNPEQDSLELCLEHHLELLGGRRTGGSGGSGGHSGHSGHSSYSGMLWAVEVLRAGPEGAGCRGSALAQGIVSSVLSGISGIPRVSRVSRPSGVSGVGEQAGMRSTATAPSPAPSLPTETTPRGALQAFFDCHHLRGLKGLRELSLLLLRRAVAGTLFETTVGLEGLTLRCEGVGPDRGALYASDVEHELIPTPEWKPGEEARPAVYSAEMLTGAPVAEAVVRALPSLLTLQSSFKVEMEAERSGSGEGGAGAMGTRDKEDSKGSGEEQESFPSFPGFLNMRGTTRAISGLETCLRLEAPSPVRLPHGDILRYRPRVRWALHCVGRGSEVGVEEVEEVETQLLIYLLPRKPIPHYSKWEFDVGPHNPPSFLVPSSSHLMTEFIDHRDGCQECQ